LGTIARGTTWRMADEVTPPYPNGKWGERGTEDADRKRKKEGRQRTLV